MTPTTPTPPRLSLGPRVRRGLALLRARVRAALSVRGLASLALAVVALSLISFGLDRMLRLEWGSRAAILVIGLTAIGSALWERLLRPLLTPLPDDELARVVEGHDARLEWRLLSAVQFADPAWRPEEHVSLDLARGVIDDAEARAPSVDFGGVVPLGPVALAALRGAAVVLAGALLVRAFPEEASIWLRRNVLLSSTARWPQDTRLALDIASLDTATRVVTVPHGSDLTIHVTAEGVVPPRVYVDTFGDAEGLVEGERPRNETLVLDGLGQGRFKAIVDEVTSGFAFTVRGGDAEETGYRVRVIRRPWVEALVFKVTPPPHTKLPARTFGVDAGAVALPVGTRVDLEARVSKPLARVVLEERAGGAAAGDVAVVHTTTLVATGFTASLLLERAAVFRLDVVDHDGLELAQPVRFSLLAEPDGPPEVQLALAGVGLNVTPQATVRTRIAARDEYGVATARLRMKVGAAGDKAPVEHEAALPELAGRTEGEAAPVLDLSTLALQPKMSLSLWAEAQDEDPRGPNVGSSATHQLRIVTADQLLGELLRRLHEQRLELERMVLEEERLAQGLSGQDQATLERAPRAHRDVGRAVVRAADVVDGVIEEMISNKLLDASTWDRLKDDVARPLRQLHQGPLQEARELAEKAGQAADAARAEASLAAGAQAGVVAQELRAIVLRMGRIEELAELVAALKKIIDKQRDLLDKTRQERPR